ncbi:MAG: MNIO family bufferin maturase [Gammaproteobacteria bacterium]
MFPVVSTKGFDGSIPASAGIGLRAPHFTEFLERRPAIEWVEVHSENYFGNGIPSDRLIEVRERWAVSLHGIGLSIGSTDRLDRKHLADLKTLIARIEPGLVSEHLSWSSIGGRYINDLLPLPYTEEALHHLVHRVAEVQERLGRTILIENISSYLEFIESEIPEWEFLAELARRSGCGVLLDVNNIYVSACNHGFDPYGYLCAIPLHSVKEIHLAGFSRKRLEDGEILIDSHSRPVAPEVWRLYEAAVARFGAIPTLIEWDSDLPSLDGLLHEASKAEVLLERSHARAA